MNYITSANAAEQDPEEVVTYCADFTGRLRPNEYLTGTPTIVELTTSALTITDKAVLAAQFVDPAGNVVEAGKGLVFTVTGTAVGSNGEDVPYVVSAKASTTLGSNVRRMRCRIVGTTK